MFRKLKEKFKELYAENPDGFSIDIACFLYIITSLIFFIFDIDLKNKETILDNVFIYTVLTVSITLSIKRFLKED